MQFQLPYFDMILSRLDCGDREFEEAFRRHVHFGAWPNPDEVSQDPADSIVAMERLCQHLIQLAEIRDGQDILDVGCGFGGTLASLDEQFASMGLTGLNIDARQVNIARTRFAPRPGNRLELVIGDACEMTFADASFDRLLAIECIFHFPSRLKFFEHARRLLRPGGNLTLTDFLQAEGAPEGLFDNTDSNFWGPYTAIDLQAYREIAARVGLVLTHHQDISAHVRPTYHFFGQLLGRHFPEAREATRVGQFIMDVGGVGYWTLRFDRKE